MRKEDGKALREAFAREMRARLPEFEPLSTASKYLFPGERVDHRRPLDSVLCIVILVPSRKDTDEFTVEIGWSKRGRFPELGMRRLHAIHGVRTRDGTGRNLSRARRGRLDHYRLDIRRGVEAAAVGTLLDAGDGGVLLVLLHQPGAPAGRQGRLVDSGSFSVTK